MVDQASKKTCTELISAGINVNNRAFSQTITRTGNTFTTNQLFTQNPGDNYWISWWLSDRSFDASNWTDPPAAAVFTLVADATSYPFTPVQGVLDSLKGKYLVVKVEYAYSRFWILQPNGLSVLSPVGIGSIAIP